MENNSHLPEAFFSQCPWSTSEDLIWPATSLAIHRNIYPYRFPGSMTEPEANQINEMIIKTTTGVLKDPKILQGDTLLPSDKEYLFEHFLLNEAFEKLDAKSSLLVDETTNFLALINIENHLNLHIFQPSTNINETWKTLNTLEQKLAEYLNFAFSPQFGFLTSDPRTCGTGLIAQAFLHTPALIHLNKFQDIVDNLHLDIKLKGISQNGEYLADIVLIENKYKLGISEKHAIETVQKAANALVTEEEKARISLNKEGNNLLKDKISRAFGLLTHSFSLQIQETLAALSLVHLAKELSWVKGAEQISFHNLFFECKRGHLQHQFNNHNLTKDALFQTRANLVKNKLANCQLSI